MSLQYSEEATPRVKEKKGIDLTLLITQVIENDEPAKVYELIPPLASLPTAEYLACKTQLREHFKRRLSVTDLDKAVKEARRKQRRATFRKRQEAAPGQGKARLIVEIDGQLRDVVQSALNALEIANKESPTLFVLSGQLVTIHFSEKKAPSIAPLTLSRLRHLMSLSADYVSIRSTSDDVVAIAVDPPLDIVRVILEGMNPIEYPFPALAGITELPILRQDGSIYATPGYDTVTEQVYIPGDLHVPAIPETPTDEDVKRALDLFDYWLADFPFEDKASKATILANAITVVARSLIGGQVPLTLLDATKQGSGKTLLAVAIGILATGRRVPTNSPTSDEEEMRKRMLTWLQTSPATVIIDNITHPLESSSLNSALTSPFIEDRELGSNTLIRVPNRAVWFASGNNIRVGDDTARRCIKCRLDAKMENPHKRDTKLFRIPNGADGFLRWTIEHRAELIEAVLILVRNWYAKGNPSPDVTPLGSFEGWTETIGGILQAASIPGFLANLDDEDGKSIIDEVSAEWSAFIDAAYTLYGETAFTCSELAKQMIGDTEQAEALRETLPTSITKHFSAYRKSQGQDSEFPTHIGYALRTRKGQVYGKLRLEASGKNRMNKALWRVARTEQEPQVSSNGHIQDRESVPATLPQETVIRPQQSITYQTFLTAIGTSRLSDRERFFVEVPAWLEFPAKKNTYIKRNEYLQLIKDTFDSPDDNLREWARDEIQKRLVEAR